ncbi:MAG TPA: hypothetical protein VII70_09085, partial [Steroidobacteraceae bacterium]
MLEIENRFGMKSRGGESLAPPDARRRGASPQAYRSMIRHVRYSAVLLLSAITALTLYGIVGEAFKPGPGPADWFAVVRLSSLNWLVALGPVAILMVLVRDFLLKRPLARVVCLVAGVICACIVGTILTDLFFNDADAAWLLANPRDVLADTVGNALPAGLLVAVYEFHRSSLAAAEAAVRLHTDQIAVEAESSKA